MIPVRGEAGFLRLAIYGYIKTQLRGILFNHQAPLGEES